MISEGIFKLSVHTHCCAIIQASYINLFQNVLNIARCVIMKQNAMNAHKDFFLVINWNVKVSY